MKTTPRMAIPSLPKVISGSFFGVAASFMLANSANALDVYWLDGEVTGAFDTTLSYGAIWRTEERDDDFGVSGSYSELRDQGISSQANKNDGNMNFNRGLVSSVAKITSELDVVYQNFGAFVRASAFYDEVIMHGTTDGGTPAEFTNSFNGNEFLPEVQDWAGSRAQFLDAYIWGDFWLGDMPLNVRVGEQVISWGESLFLQDGINQVNPANLAALRLPGAEVREALLPLPMLYMQLGITNNLTVEAFYQFDWENSEGDPVGTFLSTSDSFVGRGANRVLLDLSASGAASLAEVYNQLNGVTDPLQDDRLFIRRSADVDASKDGQFGVAFRFFAERLNNTEFGLYYLNYHSRKPVAGVTAGQALGTSVEGSTACNTVKQIAAGLPLACSDMANVLYGLPLSSPAFGGQTLEQFLAATGDANPAASAAQLASAVGGVNFVNYIDTTEYFFVYPEDIELFGLSFNTSIGAVSLAGELAYRPEAPFLPESGDNIVAYNASPTGGQATANGKTGYYGVHLGNVNANQTVLVKDEAETVNGSLVAINNFGKLMGSDRFIGLMELGFAYVGAIGDPEQTLYAANEAKSFVEGVSEDGAPSQYLDDLSWGYRLAVSADYNDVVAGINMTPSMRLSHDVSGNSVFGGNFVEGRKSASFRVDASYLFNLQFGVGYTWFWGAEDRNQLIDRDHLSASVKYSF